MPYLCNFKVAFEYNAMKQLVNASNGKSEISIWISVKAFSFFINLFTAELPNIPQFEYFFVRKWTTYALNLNFTEQDWIQFSPRKDNYTISYPKDPFLVWDALKGLQEIGYRKQTKSDYKVRHYVICIKAKQAIIGQGAILHRAKRSMMGWGAIL